MDAAVPRSLVAALAIGASLRFVLHSYPYLENLLSSRPELVTPLSSFSRLLEGIALLDHTGSAYSGDIYHQQPLLLALFHPIVSSLTEPLRHYVIVAVFILVDVLIAIGCYKLCERVIKTEETNLKESIPVSELFRDVNVPIISACVYLFNPYTLAANVALGTSCFTHLAVTYSLMFAAQRNLVLSAISLSIATYLAFYPFFLIIPIGLEIQSQQPSSSLALVYTKCFVANAVSTCLLLFASYLVTGDWTFFQETYVWVATYSDLTPNIGVFWYFFMEVFDRFVPYFLCIFHLHPYIYIFPIYLRLQNRPQAYAAVLFGLLNAFQAYPSLADFGLLLALLSMHPKNISMMKNGYLYVLGLGAASVMFPVMWFLWLFPGSGNANFFYAGTLVYQVFHSQMIAAFVAAAMKRDKDLKTKNVHS